MTGTRSEATAAQTSFHDLYAAHGRAILAYALRRVRDPQDAADVVAETFLVAWRRLADVPAGDAGRLWLYGVARRTLANQARSDRRRETAGRAPAPRAPRGRRRGVGADRRRSPRSFRSPGSGVKAPSGLVPVNSGS